MDSMIDRVFAAKKTLIPSQGYALVGIDGFSPPGDADSYVIANFPTRAEAEAALEKRVAQQSPDPSVINDRYYVFGADDG